MKEWFSLHPESELAWPPCGAVPATSAASAPAPGWAGSAVHAQVGALE